LEKNIKVVVCNVGEHPEVKDIPNTLEAFQGIVEGYIEVVRLSKEVLIVCNEEGKLMNLEPNVHTPNDILVGNLIFCGSDDEGEFASIKDNDLNLVTEFIKGGRFI
jgi:hypothetical protein